MRGTTVAVFVGFTVLTLLAGCAKKDEPAPPATAAAAAEKAGAQAEDLAKAAAAQGEAAGAQAEAAAKAAAAQAEGMAAKAEAAAKAELAKVQPLVDGAEALAKEGPALSLEAYEALLLGLESCTVAEQGIDRNCEAYKTFNEKRKTQGTALKDLAGGLAGLGRKHIGHASPAVRLQAANLTASVFGADGSSQAAIVEAAAKEENPFVLKSMLRSVGSSVRKNPAVKDLVLAKADHAEEAVRMEAATWLTSSWAAGTDATLEKAISMLDGDASLKLRKYVCSTLGKRADDRALPALEAHLKDPNDPLYDSCFRGLVEMWASPVTHETPSEAAYRRTLALLGEKPRSDKRPPWNALSGIQWAAKPDFAKAAPWYQKDELFAALKGVVTDRDAKWMARTSAVDVLLRLKAGKPVFEELLKAYADATGEDGSVKKKIEESLAKAE